jgi:hypothetical protein
MNKILLILQNTQHIESLDSQVVKQAVVEAIKNWSGSREQ